MKIDTPGQAGGLNATFDKLTDSEKTIALRLVAKARSKEGWHRNGNIYACKRPSDNKIAWAVTNSLGNVIHGGVFPE